MSELGDLIRQESERFGDKTFCLTEKGETALKILGSYKHEPPTIITYNELLKTVISPITAKEVAEVTKAGIEPKFMKHGSVEELNQTLTQLVEDKIISRIDQTTFSIPGKGSKAEDAFALFLTLEFEGCMPAGPLVLVSSQEDTGELKRVRPKIGNLIKELSEKGYLRTK